MKKFLSKPLVLDIIKVAILISTIKILNNYYKPGNTWAVGLLLLVALLLKFIFRKPKEQTLSKD
jgi:hypothetical protein